MENFLEIVKQAGLFNRDLRVAQNVAKASINDLYAYYFTQKPFVYSYFRLEDILTTT